MEAPRRGQPVHRIGKKRIRPLAELVFEYEGGAPDFSRLDAWSRFGWKLNEGWIRAARELRDGKFGTDDARAWELVRIVTGDDDEADRFRAEVIAWKQRDEVRTNAPTHGR